MASAEPASSVGVQADTTRCPECAASTAWQTRYERVCEACGLVVEEDPIDYGADWRSYPDDVVDAERTGAPESFLLPDKGLATSIDWRDRDANGQYLPPEARRRMARLRRLQRWVTADRSEGENLRVATAELSRMGAALGLSKSSTETAAIIYRRALSADLVVGRSIEGVATAALYVACRLEGVPRSLDDCAAVSRTDRTTVARMSRLLVRELDLPVLPADPREYVTRYCSALGLGPEVEAAAVEVIDRAIAAGVLAGKSPTGFAAGAVYLASQRCDAPRTQAEVAAVAGVSTMTIRTHYQEQAQAVEA